MNPWIARSGLVLGGLVAGVLLAEGGARLIAPSPAAELLAEPTRDATPGLYVQDPVLQHVPLPGYDGEWASAGGSIRVRVAPEGYRGGPPAPDKPVWWAVGDSFTLGVQVSEEDSFQQAAGDALGVSMLNGGVDGYSTWQALFRYQDLDEQLDGDGVVYVLFLGNDLTDNEVYPRLTRLPQRPDGGYDRPTRQTGQRLDAMGTYTPPTAWDRLSSRSVFLAAIDVAQKRKDVENIERISQRFRRELRPFTVQGEGDLNDLLDRLEAALRDFQSVTNERGDELLVAVAPPAWAMDPERAAATAQELGLEGDLALDAPRQGVLERLERLGIASCDLHPSLEGHPGAYLKYDGHWSVEGHALVGDALADCLR
ncbi:MAG: hypothetical protein GY913_30170 [Proteobacteria bacterium]|nr:hypothetical protein [Pseudomonadota bacterium]MCP4921184.1 hypothetical protein [Pseudomonadota bacterium]